jgi:sugar-specific transcriptional regulator TrmB
MESAEPISGRLVDALRVLGLTDYEARVYSALVALGQADAKQVYEYLGASKPNVYESLKSLSARGFVLTISAKPAIYKAVPYELVLRRLMDSHKAAEATARETLMELERGHGEEESAAVMWTLFGDRNIYNKLDALLTCATSEVRGIVPSGDDPALEYLRGRDLAVDLIVLGEGDPATAFELPRARVRHVNRHHGDRVAERDPEIEEIHRLLARNVTLFIVDDREFIYVLPGEGRQATGITSANPSLVRMASLVFKVAWGKSGLLTDK